MDNGFRRVEHTEQKIVKQLCSHPLSALPSCSHTHTHTHTRKPKKSTEQTKLERKKKGKKERKKEREKDTNIRHLSIVHLVIFISNSQRGGARVRRPTRICR